MGEKKRLGIFPKKPKAISLTESRQGKVAPTEAPKDIVMEDTVVTADNLPAALAAHFEQLTILEQKIQSADARARKARTIALDAQKKPTGFFGRKKAVEALQGSALSFAQAQSDVMDAMRVSLVYQRKISEIINQMLLLCVSNLAGTRTLLGQLQDELKKVEKGDYSETTKAEMARIIQELKAQEDMMCKQAKQSAMLHEHTVHIQEQDAHLLRHDARHDETAGEVAKANKLASDNHRKIEEMEQLLQLSENARLESERNQKITFIIAVIAVLLTIVKFFI